MEEKFKRAAGAEVGKLMDAKSFRNKVMKARVQALTVEKLEKFAGSRVCMGAAPRNRKQRKIRSLVDDMKALGVNDMDY